MNIINTIKYFLIILLFCFQTTVYSASPNWSVNSGDFQFSMNVVASLNINGVQSSTTTDSIAAFVNGQLRGVAALDVFVPSQGIYVAFLQIFSNSTSGENVTFQIYDSSNDLVLNAVNEITFSDGGAVGNPNNPYLISDNQPPTAISVSTTNVGENTILNDRVLTFSTTDPDQNEIFTYRLINGIGDTDNGLFAISNDSLLLNASLDFESKSTLSVRVQSQDSRQATIDSVFTLQVIDENDAPTDIQISTQVVMENAAIGEFILQFSATDQDPNSTFTYQLVNGAGDNNNVGLLISNDSLLLNTSLDVNVEDTLFFRVEVSDGQSGTFQKSFSIRVQDENDPPTDILLNVDSLAETLTVNTRVIQLSTQDSDVIDSFSYTLVAGTGDVDNSYFSIDGDSLVLQQVLNFEQKRTLSIRLRSTDAIGAFVEKNLTISITDANDSPTDIELNNQSVFEDAAIGSFVGRFSSVDEDAIDSYTYIFGISADNGAFIISNDSLFTNTTFDINAKDTFLITVRSTDVGGLSVEKNIPIFIKNSNDAPTDITLSDNEVVEKLARGAVIGELTTTDSDLGDGHIYSLVSGTGDDDNASFVIENNRLLADITFDFEVQNTFSIRVQTIDFADSSFQKIFQIIIRDTNDIPTDITLSTDTFSENLPIGTPIIQFSTVDQDFADAHTYVLDNAQTSDNNLFFIDGDELKTDELFNHEERANYVIFIRTTDSSGISFSRQFVLTVKDENDLPIAMELSANTIEENTAVPKFIGTFSTTDEDQSEMFVYSFTSGLGDDDNTNFLISNDSLFITITPNYELQKTYSILVRSTDSREGFIDQQYIINAINSNDQPTAINIDITQIEENNSVNIPIGEFSTTDEDNTDVHTYSLLSGPRDDDNDSFSIKDNQLIISVATDFETQSSYSVLVQSDDGNGGRAVQQFSITVNDVNEKPIIEDMIFEVSENASLNTLIGDIDYSDVDNDDEVTLTIVESNSFILNDNSLELNTSLDFEDQEVHTLTIIATDNGGLSDTASITIQVLDQIELAIDLPVNKVLSPNGDGRNDFFRINNVEIYQDYTLQIFNNSGLIIFETSAYDNTWQGEYNGSPVENGVYYYLLQNNTDNEKFFRGSISIIR